MIMTIDKTMTANMNNILSMTSAKPDMIYLPYKADGNILFHASDLLAEMVDSNGNYDETSADDMRNFRAEVDKTMAQSKIAAYVVPHVSRRFPSVGFVIEVDAPNGKRLTKRVFAPRAEKQADEILTAFFAAGAQGLNADVRESYKRQLATA